MTTASKTLIERLKLSDRTLYSLAWGAARCHPDTLSRLLRGAARLKPNDPRIVAVGRELGLSPEECFEVED